MSDSTSFDEALELHQNGRIAEAEAIYRRVLHEQPNHPGTLHLLGVVRQQQGDHEAALELIGRAISINANKAVYHNNYGAALLSLERFREAEASFHRALAICPHYPDALANLGMVQTLRDEEAAAEASFRQALRIDPWHRDATTRLAALLGKRGRDTEARQLLEAALAAAPCPEFHAALGNLFFREGLPDLAAQQYRTAIKLKPSDAIAHFNLGSAYEEVHDTSSTRHHFAQAAILRPEKRLWRLRAELCGPVVFENSREIEEYCEGVSGVLQRWTTDEPSSPAPLPEGERGERLDEILEAGVIPGFTLSYHGRDQRRLKERFAAMYEPYFKDQSVPQDSGLKGRRRIGFCVTRRTRAFFSAACGELSRTSTGTVSRSSLPARTASSRQSATPSAATT